MLRPRSGLALALTLSSSWCLAQVPPSPDPAPPRGAVAPPPATVAPGATAPPGEAPQVANNEVVLPEVSDPMLEEVPEPPRVLQSWREALRHVRSRSTSLASSLAQVENAAARARAALSRTRPTLNATGSVSQHLLFGRGTNITAEGAQINVDIPNPSTLWNARLSFRQPILNLGTWYDIDTAELSQKGARQRAEDAERVVLANVADTIVLVVTAERLAEVSRVSLRSSLSTLDLTRRRARLGASSAVDVLRAEQEVALNRAQVVNANESLQRAREALGMALGYAEPWGVRPDISLDRLGQDARQVCAPAATLDDRADIKAAQTDVQVARRTSESVDYRLAPTIDLVSDLNYTTAPFTANGEPLQWTVGGVLTIPLYDGGARTAERQTALTQVELAEQALTQAKRQATLEVRQALRSVDVAQQNFVVSQQSREISKETSRLARLSFLNGKGTSFELVDATRRYQQAELDLAVKEFEVVRARILALLAQSNCDL